MATMSKEYWEKRQHEREVKAYSSILKVEKEYKEALERAKININKQISHIGTQYMKDNQLGYAEAMKQLKGAEYKVWRKQLDEYMQEWKQLKRTAPMEAKKLWLEIETLSARSRISRLDSIRTQIDIELSKVSTEAVESTRKALYGVYGDTYKEVVKDLGIKSMFSDSMVKAVIARPWSGANYSNRIWGNSEKLARVLKQEVTTGMIQGINLKTMGKRISDRIEGAKKNDVERLLRTEVNYTMNQATLDGYKDAKIEKYTFDATLDSRTSQICAELNGETFELSKVAVGVNYPPMHPRCRSTTTPLIDFEALGERLRKEKGVVEREEIDYNKKDLQVKSKERNIDIKQLKQVMPENEYNDFVKNIQGCDSRGLRLLYKKYGDDLSKIEFSKKSGYYQPSTNTLVACLSNPDEISKGVHKFSVLAHEYGHKFDNPKFYKGLSYKELELLNEKVRLGKIQHFKTKPSSSDEFLKALRLDKEILKSTFANIKEDLLSRNSSGGVQDALDGMFNTYDSRLLPIGHGNTYYNRKYDKIIKPLGLEKDLKEAFQELGMKVKTKSDVRWACREYETASEAFANIASAVVCGGEELEYTKKYMPNMYEAYLKIVENVT